MKKAILLILALAMLCTAVCACTDGGNVNDNHGGVVTDNAHDSDIGGDIGDDIKDDADDVGDAVKDGAENTARPDTSPAQPQATAIPGTQVITP